MRLSAGGGGAGGERRGGGGNARPRHRGALTSFCDLNDFVGLLAVERVQMIRNAIVVATTALFVLSDPAVSSIAFFKHARAPGSPRRAALLRRIPG